jgi:hypothetical protein
METDYRARSLKCFSGYIAIDELYDGPFCVLSLVDNRTFTRLTFRVLEKDPTQDAIRAFLGDFKAHLAARGLKVWGVTTDGSNLDPVPRAELCPDVPHQVCRFHVLQEITKAVLHAWAKLRKEMKAQLPKRPRGRPQKDPSRAVRRTQRQEQRINDLFEHRYLFVRKKLTVAEKRTWQRITRGRPPLRVLRSIRDEVDRLFDRRCRTVTALGRLARLRARAGATLPADGPGLGQAVHTEPGDGADVPGRQAVAGDKQRRRAGQPPVSPGATEHRLGADGGAHPPTDRVGHAPRAAGARPVANHESPAPSPRRTMTTVYFVATVSE